MKMVLNSEGFYEPDNLHDPYRCHFIGGPVDGKVVLTFVTPLDIAWDGNIYRYAGRRNEDCQPRYRFLPDLERIMKG